MWKENVNKSLNFFAVEKLCVVVNDVRPKSRKKY